MVSPCSWASWGTSARGSGAAPDGRGAAGCGRRRRGAGSAAPAARARRSPPSGRRRRPASVRARPAGTPTPSPRTAPPATRQERQQTPGLQPTYLAVERHFWYKKQFTLSRDTPRFVFIHYNATDWPLSPIDDKHQRQTDRWRVCLRSCYRNQNVGVLASPNFSKHF